MRVAEHGSHFLYYNFFGPPIRHFVSTEYLLYSLIPWKTNIIARSHFVFVVYIHFSREHACEIKDGPTSVISPPVKGYIVDSRLALDLHVPVHVATAVRCTI